MEKREKYTLFGKMAYQEACRLLINKDKDALVSEKYAALVAELDLELENPHNSNIVIYDRALRDMLDVVYQDYIAKNIDLEMLRNNNLPDFLTEKYGNLSLADQDRELTFEQERIGTLQLVKDRIKSGIVQRRALAFSENRVEKEIESVDSPLFVSFWKKPWQQQAILKKLDGLKLSSVEEFNGQLKKRSKKYANMTTVGLATATVVTTAGVIIAPTTAGQVAVPLTVGIIYLVNWLRHRLPNEKVETILNNAEEKSRKIEIAKATLSNKIQEIPENGTHLNTVFTAVEIQETYHDRNAKALELLRQDKFGFSLASYTKK